MKTTTTPSSAPVLDLDPMGQPTDDSAAAESLRQVMAVAWLAESSPLAAPEDSLDRLRETLGMTTNSTTPARSLRWPMTALAGWGAAAALAVLWLNQPRQKSERRGVELPTPARVHEVVINAGAPATSMTPVPQEPPNQLTPIDDPVVLRREIASLRERLLRGALDIPGAHQAVVFELAPPGATASKVSQAHLLEIIASALEQNLTHRTAAAESDEVVIERGWAKWNASEVKPDTVYRHRAFPVERAAELGLQPGPQGQFLDPGTGWLWTPDPLTGDYTGRIAPQELDRQGFTKALVVEQKVATQAPTLAQSTPAPEGYLVGAGDGQSILTLNNLPTVGSFGTMELVTSQTTGETQRFILNPTNGTFSAIVPTAGGSLSGLSVISTGVGGQTNVILQSGSQGTGH